MEHFLNIGPQGAGSSGRVSYLRSNVPSLEYPFLGLPSNYSWTRTNFLPPFRTDPGQVPNGYNPTTVSPSKQNDHHCSLQRGR